MINLLPQEEKNTLYQKQVEKLITVLGMVFFVGLICLFFILLSVRLYILGQTASQKFILEEAQKTAQSPEFLNFKNLISEYDADLARADSFYKNQIYMSQALNILFGVPRPQGLYFTGVSLDAIQKDKKEVEIVVSGTSDTRDNLTLFKKNIEDEKRISNAYFPPESWINSKDINFNITMGILKAGVGNNNIGNEFGNE
jgi:hypothetical protein